MQYTQNVPGKNNPKNRNKNSMLYLSDPHSPLAKVYPMSVHRQGQEEDLKILFSSICVICFLRNRLLCPTQLTPNLDLGNIRRQLQESSIEVIFDHTHSPPRPIDIQRIHVLDTF